MHAFVVHAPEFINVIVANGDVIASNRLGIHGDVNSYQLH